MPTKPLLTTALALSIALAAGMFLTLNSAPLSAQTPAAATAAASPARAIAVLVPTKGNTAVSGTVRFDKTPTGLKVSGSIAGLAPNSVHGFHVHEFGDMSSDDGMAAGTHYNPENHAHGGPETPAHHVGDMGNVTADASGKVTLDISLTNISLADKNPILGRAVVLHAAPDNLMPNANPGRLALGLIGIAKP